MPECEVLGYYTYDVTDLLTDGDNCIVPVESGLVHSLCKHTYVYCMGINIVGIPSNDTGRLSLFVCKYMLFIVLYKSLLLSIKLKCIGRFVQKEPFCHFYNI